ncbi:MAG: HD domain-containing protein [Candidatus Omnitrophota bacterium]
MNLEFAQQLMQKFTKDPEHAVHVEKLSLNFFDQLKDLHLCGEMERQYLQCAALLHDIGCAVSYRKHHLHSYRIILDAHFPSLTAKEKQIVALIARYHRKSTPKLKHPEFLSLSQRDQTIVKRMSALLRIADALDRSRSHKIADFRCVIQKNECCCLIEAMGDCLEEKASVIKRKNLFMDVFGIDFQIVDETKKEIEPLSLAAPEPETAQANL